jgi:hypothetical protein
MRGKDRERRKSEEEEREEGTEYRGRKRESGVRENLIGISVEHFNEFCSLCSLTALSATSMVSASSLVWLCA